MVQAKSLTDSFHTLVGTHTGVSSTRDPVRQGDQGCGTRVAQGRSAGACPGAGWCPIVLSKKQPCYPQGPETRDPEAQVGTVGCSGAPVHSAQASRVVFV